MTATTVAMSGDQNINALLSGVKWAGTVLTFGFPTDQAQYGDNYTYMTDHDNNPATPNVQVDETNGFVALNGWQNAVTQVVFKEFRDLTLMSALEVQPANSADIHLGMSTSMTPGNSGAYTIDYPGDSVMDGDVWFDTASFNAPRVGTNAYQTFYHEIGHALGLKHGHEADNGNNWVHDRRPELVRILDDDLCGIYRAVTAGSSKVVSGHYAQSFMMYDIAALQHMYGADFTEAQCRQYDLQIRSHDRGDDPQGQVFRSGPAE